MLKKVDTKLNRKKESFVVSIAAIPAWVLAFISFQIAYEINSIEKTLDWWFLIYPLLLTLFNIGFYRLRFHEKFKFSEKYWIIFFLFCHLILIVLLLEFYLHEAIVHLTINPVLVLLLLFLNPRIGYKQTLFVAIIVFFSTYGICYLKNGYLSLNKQTLIIQGMYLTLVCVIVNDRSYSLLKKTKHLFKKEKEIQKELFDKKIELETEHKKVEDAHNCLIIEHEKYLQSENRLSDIGTMTGGIVHDFKNPVSSIMLIGELIEKGMVSSEKLSEKARVIINESARINDMLMEILDYSRGEVSLSKYRFDVREYLSKTEEFLKGYLEENIKVKLELKYEGQIIADKNKLRRVFYNLGINAKEAMKDGGTITLGSHQEKNEIVLWVKDTGCGIPEEIQNKLLKEQVSAGKTKGTGFGTRIAKSVVEAHGGTLSFETKKGSGTTFFIRLPLDQIEL